MFPPLAYGGATYQPSFGSWSVRENLGVKIINEKENTMERIFAQFDNHEHAVKAGGALLDHGVSAERFDLLGGRHLSKRFSEHHNRQDLEGKENKIEHGVTTTTSADAKEGAKKGGGAGLVLGAIGGLAALFIPGYGIVVGSGALATAIGAAIGTGAAGAVAGGATGYLKDMGVEEHIARDFEKSIDKGGAVIALEIQPDDKITESEARKVLEKYGANRIELGASVAHR